MIKNYKIFSDLWHLSDDSILGAYIRSSQKTHRFRKIVCQLLDKKRTSKRKRQLAKWGKAVYQWEMKCIKLTDQCTTFKQNDM
jgi:hypothetical protein